MAEVSELKLPEVMAVDEIAMLAVTVPLIAGSEPMVTELPTVTEEMLIGTVPLMLAVTEPIWAVPAARAGSDPMVTEFPTVTEEIEMGTVPLMDAVTEPIWFVPAASAGSEPMVTLLPTVTLPICDVPADNAGKELSDTGRLVALASEVLPMAWIPE